MSGFDFRTWRERFTMWKKSSLIREMRGEEGRQQEVRGQSGRGGDISQKVEKGSTSTIFQLSMMLVSFKLMRPSINFCLVFRQPHYFYFQNSIKASMPSIFSFCVNAYEHWTMSRVHCTKRVCGILTQRVWEWRGPWWRGLTYSGD